MSTTGTRTRRAGFITAVATTSLLGATVLAGAAPAPGSTRAAVVAGASSNRPIAYNVTATSGQIVLKKGDPTNERTIDDLGVTLAANVDDPSGAISANTVFRPSFTPNQAGPFGLIIYIKAEILQVTPFTGTVAADGSVDVTGQQNLAVTVYRTVTGTVGQSDAQNPSTDQVLANGTFCRSLINLHLTGQYDGATSALTIGQDPFTIPLFPADTRSTGGTQGCALATDSINSQLAGPNNSLSLTFGGPAALPPAMVGRLGATPGNGQAVLDGVRPADYGSPITGYTITPYLNGVPQATQMIGPDGPAVITGLTNGGTYTFTAAATNANGTGPPSTPTNAVIIGAPARPEFPSATGGVASAQVRFWPPSGNGSPVLTYTVTPSVGGVAQSPQTFPAVSNQLTVIGLVPGTSYTFSIVANNAVGAGPASLPTNAVVPSGGPAA